MKILFVDDEEGIREGCSSYLRLKGHTVRSAACLEEALLSLSEDEFDLLVSDWRLGDEVAASLVERAPCPCIVVSGFPDEVAGLSRKVHVLAKPMPMDQLLQTIESLEPSSAQSEQDSPKANWDRDLPMDARDRIRLVLALAGKEAAEGSIVDDGNLITLQIPWSGEDAALEQIETFGGDLRVLADGAETCLEYRVRRDGCPDGYFGPLRPEESWPDDVEFLAIDLHGSDGMRPDRFLDLLDQCRRAESTGREICLLNVPTHLSLFLDALGRTGELPKRRRAGPCLPEVLSELWG
ncbi:MAG: response regulator [Planctomycetota bacterium]|jgi:CheY-like chemotaxis protein